MKKIKTIGDALVSHYGPPPKNKINRLFAKEFEGTSLEADQNGVYLHGIMVRRVFGVNFRKKRTYRLPPETLNRFR